MCPEEAICQKTPQMSEKRVKSFAGMQQNSTWHASQMLRLKIKFNYVQ
jgi:hypothetical protein